MYRIKELRLERGWTQEYLGKLLNVNKSAISKYENDKSDVTAQTIINLSKIFQVPADYLLGLSSVSMSSNYELKPTIELPLLENDNYTTEDIKVLQYFGRLNDENKDEIKGKMVALYKDQILSSKATK